MKDDLDSILPKKAWFTLREICDLKGLCYKTATNRPRLQPASDGEVGGRKMFRRKTVLKWLDLSDKDIIETKESVAGMSSEIGNNTGVL